MNRQRAHSQLRVPRPEGSDTRGGERVLGVRVVHHLDRLAITKRCQVGAERHGLVVLRRGSHDHDDLVARVHNVDEFTRRLRGA
jgi:hypothetical protein